MTTTLYSREFDVSVPYFIYYSYKRLDINPHKLDYLNDNTIIKVFEKVIQKYNEEQLIDKCLIFKIEEFEKVVNNQRYVNNNRKYVRRYQCNCYNWICDTCLEDQNIEILSSTCFVINKRFLLDSIISNTNEDDKECKDFINEIILQELNTTDNDAPLKSFDYNEKYSEIKNSIQEKNKDKKYLPSNEEIDELSKSLKNLYKSNLKINSFII